MRRRLALACGLPLAALLLMQAPAQDAPKRNVPDPAWQAPAEAAAKTNPLAGNPELAAGGRKVFRRHCAQCHGEDGALGKKHSANLQLPLVQQESDGALFWKISNGNLDRGMPEWSRLTEAQRWQLVMYIRSLGK